MDGIEGFEAGTLSVGGARVGYEVGGAGPPVLLVHGFPQTRLAWRKVGPRLAERFTVVCVDLPGYGGSERLGPGPEGFEKSRVAEHLIAVMAALGHDRFGLVGHDRGALVAFRAALDHPEVISHLGVLDVIPTVDNWAALAGPAGVFAFHLYLLAQPPELPESMIGADPDLFFGHFLDAWTKVPDAIEPEVRAHYLAAARRPEAIRAVCDDYRASAFLDLEPDRADQDQDRRLTMPVLAAWQDPGDAPLPFDPEQVWSGWAPTLSTRVVPCGHFLPEERPDDIAAAITELLAR